MKITEAPRKQRQVANRPCINGKAGYWHPPQPHSNEKPEINSIRPLMLLPGTFVNTAKKL